MRILVGEKLSQHKYKTPEGYLVCTDAILARTGKQTYLRNEVFNDGSEEEVEIDRTPEEVFNEKTITSFENKPITIEHPNEEVNVDNYKEYAVGFVRDVRRDVVDGNEVLKGNLIITDKEAIDLIERGEMNELSCGYDCDILDEENPQQRNIRGNHLALCKHGRAGIARIVDSINVDSIKDDALEDFFDLLDDNNIDYDFISGGYGIEFRNNYSYTKAKELAKKVRLIKGVWDDRKLTYHNFSSTSVGQDSINDDDVPLTSKQWIDINKAANRSSYTVQEISNAIQKLYKQKPFLNIDECVEKVLSNIKNGNYLLDSINDVEPRTGESKEDFIKRFMSETVNEYPDEKQRYAVALKYWKGKDSMKDTLIKDYNHFTLNKQAKLNYKGRTLYRVYYGGVVIGGWAESEKNIEGYAEVLDEAKVYGNAIVKDAAKISGQAEVYENAIVKDYAEISGQAKVYGNAKIYDSGEVKDKAKAYGSVVVIGEVENNAEVYGNANVQGKVKDNAKICGDVWISSFSKVYGKAIVDGNAQIRYSEIYGNAQIHGNTTVESSKVFGNAIVKDKALVENSEIQGTTIIKGNMKVKDIKISSNKDLENLGIKDSINDSYVVITIGQQYSLDTEKFRREMAFYGLRCEFGPLQGDSRKVRIWGTRQQLKNASYEYPAIEYATIKDSIEDSINDNSYPSFLGNVNGTMREFNPKEFVNKVIKERKSLHTNRISKATDDVYILYHIVIDVLGVSLENCEVSVDIVKKTYFREGGDADDFSSYKFKEYQDRILMKDCGKGKDKWEKAINILNDFKSKHLNDSIEYSIHDEKYIYLYAKSDITPEDKIMMKRYGLEILGTNRFGGEVNLAVKGDLSTLKKFNKEYMAYEMHPDYLYKEHQFGGEITRDSENENENDKNKLKDILKIAKIAEKFIK